jgi:hypothetical protein
MDREAIFTQLKWSLQAMACDGETQISLFPDFIVASDEIINDFEHWRRIVESRYKSEFSSGQIESLNQIDEIIDKIIKSQDEIWGNDSLTAHKFWRELRSAGNTALNEFSWKFETPSKSRSIFIS